MSLAIDKIKYFLLLALLKIILLPDSAIAQIPTINESKEKVFEEERLYLPLASGRLKLDLRDDIYDLNYLNLDRLPASIELKQIKVIGNTVISTSELQALIDSQAKETISLGTLRQIIQRINKAYRDRGYVTSGVFSEPKLHSNGIIFIPVTEGKIEEVRITGLNRLRTNYIRDRGYSRRATSFKSRRIKASIAAIATKQPN